MLKWVIVLVLTVGLCGGSWYLYTRQPVKEPLEAVVLSDETLAATISLDPAAVQTREVTLFVGDPNTGALVRKIGNIEAILDLPDAIIETMRQLLAPDEETRNAAIPEGTELLSIFVTNSGTVYVNLNRHLQDHHIGGLAAEFATVTSLVNTLLFNFKEIRQVQLLVEGSEIETLAGHIDCRKPFSKMLLLQNS